MGVFTSMITSRLCKKIRKTHLLPSPIPNFMLSSDDTELEEIRTKFQEALPVLEVDKIFSHKK